MAAIPRWAGPSWRAQDGPQDGPEAGPAPGLSWGKLGVNTTPPNLKVEGFRSPGPRALEDHLELT